jgi:hypothetical protein
VSLRSCAPLFAPQRRALGVRLASTKPTRRAGKLAAWVRYRAAALADSFTWLQAPSRGDRHIVHARTTRSQRARRRQLKPAGECAGAQ